MAAPLFPPLPGLTVVRLRVAEGWPRASAEAVRLAEEARFAEPRRRQFLAGRAAATQALAQLGMHDTVVGRDAKGTPVWPTGCVGSIAHTAVEALAAAAQRTHWLAVGVDVEADLPLPEDAARVVLTAHERDWLAKAHSEAPAAAATVLFCLKECVHKALNPLVGAWLEFDEVQAHFADGSAHVTPLSAAARQAFAGLDVVGHVAREQGQVHARLAVRAADR